MKVLWTSFPLYIIGVLILTLFSCLPTGPDPVAMPNPVLSPVGGTYNGPLSIENTTDYSGYTEDVILLQYTSDGSDPGSVNPVTQTVEAASFQLELSEPGTYIVKIFACPQNVTYFCSGLVSETYTIE